MARDRRRVGGVGEPLTRAGRDPTRADAVDDGVRRQEVVLHELAERAAELILALGDDGGVRDREAEWVTEESGNGEPVGEAADHRGLGRGAHETEPSPIAVAQKAEQEHRGRGEEQAGGPALGDRQLRELRLVVADGWQRGRGGAHRHGAHASGASPTGPHEPWTTRSVTGTDWWCRTRV